MAKLIVIDGLDGSGKATQSEILKSRLEADGYNVYKISFPNYYSKSSGPIQMYLGGEIGDNVNELSPYGCSAFYAIDRFITYIRELKKIFEDKSAVVIADRYVSSNIIHQASKIEDDKERIEFYRWLYDLEYIKFGLPKEDILIYLDMPVWKSQSLMSKRYDGEEDKKDLHESNKEYLNTCRKMVYKAAEYFHSIGDHWEMIDCLRNDGDSIREINDIADEIYKLVISILK